MEKKALRKCRVCGLEAKTQEDLELFARGKTKPYGRTTICNKCNREHKIKPKIIFNYLRKCKICGIEAHVEKDLVLFSKGSKRCLYGKANICKKCHNLISRKKENNNPLHRRWKGMMDRCYGPNTHEFSGYGGRGIIVCDEWKTNKQSFYDWANNHGFKPELTLDRIDVNGSYSPENCRWVDWLTQERNRRNHVTNWEKGTRICSKCKIEKPLTEFNNDLSASSGKNFACRECQRVLNKKYRKKPSLKKLKVKSIKNIT